jgi:integrase
VRNLLSAITCPASLYAVPVVAVKRFVVRLMSESSIGVNGNGVSCPVVGFDAVFENGVKVSGRKSNVDWAFNALLEYFGSKKLRAIKPSDLESFKSARLNGITRKGIKRNIATVNRELSFLRSMLSFALQNDWIIQNPFTKAKGIIAVAAETERDRILSFEEELRLLSVCVSYRAHLRPILICALDTAMRRGEIFKMKWSDVDFSNNEILIPQTNTKTEESRIVGITPRLKDELITLWEVSPKDKNQLVFGVTITIKTAWKTACRLANVQDFRFHDCRHTATTRMIASGSPHTEVMKITGHLQLKTFLRYLNITSETANKVASRLSDYLVGRQQILVSEVSDTLDIFPE